MDLNKFTMYCGGKNYVIPKLVDAAQSENQFQKRVQNDLVEQFMRTAQRQENTQAQQQQNPLFNLPPALRPAIQTLTNLLQFTGQLTQNLANGLRGNTNAQQNQPQQNALLNGAQAMLQGIGTPVVQLAAMIANLFLGFKKANDKVEEREQRENFDESESDLFSTQKLNASEGATMGQGGG